MIGRIELIDENDHIFLIIDEEGNIISKQDIIEDDKKKEDN